MEVWRKNLYILWGTQFLAMLGMNLVVPFFPFYVRELGVQTEAEVAIWSGIAFSGTFVSAFFATPFWGTLGDTYGRKPMVIRALFGLAFSQVMIGLAQDIYQLVLFRLLQGAISGFIASALALVSTNTPKERIGYALGVLQSATAAGMVLGPFVGGLLADSIGYRTVFFITAALCTAGGTVVLLNVSESRDDQLSARRFTVMDNYRLTFRKPQLRMVAMTLVSVQVAVLMIEPIFALFIESFGTETEYLSTLAGGVFSIAGIFMVISGPWWGRRNDRIGHRRNLTMALAGSGLAYGCHIIVGSIEQLGVLRAFLGFSRGAILPGLYSLVSIHTPADRRGGVMAVAASFTLLGNSFGPILGGFVAGRFGIRTSFAVTCSILLIVSLFVWRFFPDDRPGKNKSSPDNPVGDTVSQK